MNLDAALADASRYERELERLHARLPARRLRALVEDGVPLKILVVERRRVARLLAEAVAGGEWAPRPATVRLARLDKERLLYGFGALDTVVHGVVAEILGEAVEPLLSPRVFSYRRGRSAHQAVRLFAREVRRHVAARPDPRARGLYVLHCDVESFGDSVPLGPASPLWADIAAALEGRALALVERLVRPRIVDDGEAEAWRGLPTGSPVVPPLTNLYLAAVDRAALALPGFYLRYGDDLLYAHDDAELAQRALAAIEGALAARGLRLNPRKKQVVWLNGAGRGPAWAAARGATAVELLGLRVDARGTVSLPRRKLRELLSDVRARVARSHALLGAEALPAVVDVVAAALDPASPFATRHASLLARVVTDRGQLAHIDRLVALAVAAAGSARPGVRAFREAPPRRLRALGLPSLARRRDRGA